MKVHANSIVERPKGDLETASLPAQEMTNHQDSVAFRNWKFCGMVVLLMIILVVSLVITLRHSLNNEDLLATQEPTTPLNPNFTYAPAPTPEPTSRSTDASTPEATSPNFTYSPAPTPEPTTEASPQQTSDPAPELVVPKYDINLVNGGAVVARAGKDTMYPCVIRIPGWVSSTERADPSAKYYMYYGEHHGDHISMKWASSIRGPWAQFDLGGSRHGVLDFAADSSRSTRGDNHIAAPEVYVDNKNKRFVLFFHGKNNYEHMVFAATSSNGLNFNDPDSGGQRGHGPQTVTVAGESRDLIMMRMYTRIFTFEGKLYAFGKKGKIRRPRDQNDILKPNPDDPFGITWEPQTGFTVRDWMASSEFTNHPNNPVPGTRIPDNEKRGYCNHNSVSLLPGGLIEYLFWIRFDPGDKYNSLYRIIWNITDPNWKKWTIARDDNGMGMFDVVVTPDEISDAVKAAHPSGVDPVAYADPSSLGSSFVFVDDDGRKYLFVAYYSKALGGDNEADGQIMSLELVPHE